MKGENIMADENEKIMEEGNPDVGNEQPNNERVMHEGISGEKNSAKNAETAESMDAADIKTTAVEATEHDSTGKKRKSRKKSADTKKPAEPEKSEIGDVEHDSSENSIDIEGKKRHAEYLAAIRNIEKAVDNVYSNEDNGRIVSVNGLLEAESTEQKVKDIKASLIDSFRNRHILRGTISGVISSPESTLIYAELFYEGIKVIFPMNEIIDVDGLSEKRDPKAFALSLMQNRQGSEIDFVVAGCDGINIAGRHREAMKQQRYRYYLRSDRNGDAASYRIEVGKVVECRIVSVMMKSLILEIHGVEIFESVEDLSWEYIFDARENYYPGMMLTARVMSLDATNKDHIEITVSVKELLPNVQLKVAKTMKENSSYCGTVNYLDELGHVYVKLSNGADCRCNCFDNMPRPKRGTRVIVLLKHIIINEKAAILFGLITRAYSARR